MPDEEQKQPSQQPAERERTQVRGDDSIHRDTARDGEALSASGARPSPNPDPDPKAPEGPINKAADLTDVVRAADAPPAPAPAPTPDSSEGEN